MPHRLSASPVLDSLSNLAASLNAGGDKQAGDAFFAPVLGRGEIEAMYRGDWLARKIVDIVPYDCVREGREWHGAAADVAKIEALERRLGLFRTVQRAIVMGRLYGGGAIIVGTRESDPASLARELHPEAIGPGGVAFLHAVSRWQLGIAEIERDPLSPWFGEPKAYQVVAPERGALTLHPSRVIRFLGNPLPDPGLAGAETWSDSVLSTLYDAIHAVALTTTGATSLMHEAKVDVVTVPNLSEHLSNAATTAQLSARFAYAATMKSLNNLLLLGDGESWTRQRVDFGGLPEMVRTFLQVAAGAADIPVTRLLGQSPAGLSATGDSDTRNYYDMIAARQEIDLRPQLERLDRFLFPAVGLALDALRFEFRPLWQMDAAAKAAVSLQKAQATQIYAGLGLWPTEAMAGLVAGQLAEDGTYPDAGAVLGSAVQSSLALPNRQTVADDGFNPAQPRDPNGRWAEGGAGSTGGSEGTSAGIAGTSPHTLTIRPTKSIASPAQSTSKVSAWNATNSVFGQLGGALGFLNPIGPARAGGGEEEDSRLAGELSDPTAEIRIERYANAHNELKSIDPNNPALATARPMNWVPSDEAIQWIEGALGAARAGQAGPPSSAPDQEGEAAQPSAFASTSEQVTGAISGRPAPPRIGQSLLPEAAEIIARVASESALRSKHQREVIPQGDFGSIVRAEGITIPVKGKTAVERGHSYEQGIRDMFGSGSPTDILIPRIERRVDDVIGQQIFEAKRIDVYMKSIYNPGNPRPWQGPALERVINQARVITEVYEGGAIYFTNDERFAADYVDIFHKNGIVRFRFVIVPSTLN